MREGTPLARAFVRLAVDRNALTDDVRSSVRQAGSAATRDVEAAGKRISDTFKRSVQIGAGIVGVQSAFGAVSKIVRTGVGELKDYQAGQAQLQTGLRSTGAVAGVTADQLENLASTVQNYSGQTDDSIVKTESLLLTFTNIRNEVGRGNDVFTQTVKIAADMAARMGGDASGAAIQLGKALNDPVKGITALTRVGVSFTQQQKDQIAAMVKAGDTMGAQKLILGELNTEFGGSAKAYGQTLPGEIDKAQRKFEDFTQGLAQDTLPTVIKVGHAAGDLVHLTEDVVGFFEHNEVAAAALATILSAALVPAAGRAVTSLTALAEVGIKKSIGAGVGLLDTVTKLNPAVLATAGVVGGAVAVYEHYAHVKGEATQATDAFVTALGKESEGQAGAKLQTTIAELNKLGVGDNIQRLGININDVARAVDGSEPALTRVKTALTAVLTAEGADPTILKDALAGIGPAFETTVTSSGRSVTSIKAHSAALQQDATDAAGLEKVINTLSGSLDAAARKRAAQAANQRTVNEALGGPSAAAQAKFFAFLGVAQQAEKTLQQVTGQANQSLSSQVDLLSDYSDQAQVTAAQLETNLKKNLEMLAGEGANLQTLAANGLDPAFIKSLVDKGPEYVAAAASSSLAEQQKLNTLYTQGETQRWHTAAEIARTESPAAANAINGMQQLIQQSVENTTKDVQILNFWLHALQDTKRVTFLSNGVPDVVGDISRINTALDKIGESYVVSVGGTGRKEIPGQSTGGEIIGPGGPRDDKAGIFRLSNGEHVTNTASARVNRALLKWMDGNPGKRIPGMADGGSVDVFVNTQQIAGPVADAIRGLEASSVGVSGGAARLTPIVSQVLAELGLAQGLLPKVMRQITTESGGNPTIVNRSDSNWFAGHPSVGDLQVIGPTFAAYAGKYAGIGPFEYGVSVNDKANIFAGLNYAMHRYGPELAGLGEGHGYDRGGPWPSGTVGWNTSGRTEHVFTGDQMDALTAGVQAMNRQLGTLIELAGGAPAATGKNLGAALNSRASYSRMDARTRPGAARR